MKSPFKMKPGRGNMPKTGKGISPTLMSYSPMKQNTTELELTAEYNRGKKKIADARNVPGHIGDLKSAQGINIDAASGFATAAEYGKKYIQGGRGQRDRIIGGDGQVVAEAKKTNFFKGERNADLYKQHQQDSTSTMRSRNKNTMQYNITSGSKSPNDATETEKELLKKLGKAKKTK